MYTHIGTYIYIYIRIYIYVHMHTYTFAQVVVLHETQKGGGGFGVRHRAGLSSKRDDKWYRRLVGDGRL